MKHKPLAVSTRTKYPRVSEKLNNLLSKVRAMKLKRPSPTWHSKNISDPANLVLDALLMYSKKKLRRLCRFHSLDHIGSRFILIRRMYLHWRASKLRLGKVYIGYGKGYEYTQKPICVCGFRLRADIEREEKASMQAKLDGRILHAKCRAVFEEYTRRAIEFQRTGVRPMEKHPRIGINKYPRIS